MKRISIMQTWRRIISAKPNEYKKVMAVESRRHDFLLTCCTLWQATRVSPFPFLFFTSALAADLPKDILEKNCLSCHCDEKKKGSLLLQTKDDLLQGGESGAAIDLTDIEKSELLHRISLPADDEDIMPPKKSSKPLSGEEISQIRDWLKSGAAWQDGLVLHPFDPKAMPPHDAAADSSITKIEAFPKNISLETKNDFHKPVIIAHFQDATTRDITSQVKLSVADEKIAALKDGTLTPLADGTTELKISYRTQSTSIPVVVKKSQEMRPVSFQLDVMPILTAAGCNTGSCHGAAAGKDGFHLSLFGFDPHGDHFRLTNELPGRRINFALPEESLMITKAIGKVPHTGGKLLDEKSTSYQTLIEWIKNGANIDDDDKIPHPTHITVEPPQLVLKGKELRTPLTVKAFYSDGSDRDVTKLTTFSSSNDNSVMIAKNRGNSESKNPGDALLLGRFMTFVEGSQVIVIPEKDHYQKPNIAPYNYIDAAVLAKLEKLRIVPSEICSDEEFLRRIFLDVVGKLPTIEERQTFLSNKNEQKRIELVDALIARKEFAEIWTMKWAELLQIRTFDLGEAKVSYKAALNYYNWLRDRIAANTPFNQIVRELLSAEGGTFSVPATNYFQTETDVLKVTENIAQVFMGTRIQCAQCHNHPFDRWTMEDYYGFASFFAQVKRKQAEDPRERIVFDGDGEVPHLVTKQPVPPKFLGGERPKLEGKTRRQAVGEWLASPDNPWFARNVSNIMWSHFFGIGIINPVDDIRVSNPAANPELLDELAKHFRDYNFDIKKLVRDICTSRTYQLSSQTNETNAADERNFSHSLVRRIRAEVLLDALSQVTNTENKFKGLPIGARAVQIADGNTSTYFLTTFGRASRATVCSCEVKLEPNLSQALHLINGDNTHMKIQEDKVIAPLINAKKSNDEILNQFWLSALCRMPTDAEKKSLLEKIEQDKSENHKEVLQDIFWALLNSKEFIFNH